MKFSPNSVLRYPDEMTFCFVSGETLQVVDDPFIGSTLDGRFRLDKKLADGAWTRTYRASHRLVARPCLVDIIAAPLNPEQQACLTKSLALARRCMHPNITEIIAGGTTPDGVSYLVNPIDQGTALGEVLRQGVFPLSRALGVAAQLLAALARIHDFGVTHGDIHPLNVRLGDGDFARIQNVSVGRATLMNPWADDPQLLAMQSYLAPERCTRAAAGTAGDIYGVGALVYHMMTGRLPVEADNVTELSDQLSDPASDPTSSLPDMPETLQQWMRMIMNRDLTLRVDNAHQALVELQSRAGECGIVIPKASAPEVASGILALDGDFSRWNHFRQVFEEMVALGYPQGAPPATSEALLSLISRVSQLDEIAKNTRYQYGLLEEIEQRSREGRQQIAEQMDALNENGSQLRIELHPLRIAASRHAEKVASYPEEMRNLHAQVITWEGRSGFAEPYPQLAAAYRAAADLVDKWHGLRQAELSCRAEASERDEELARTTAELAQLRESLRVHESNSGAERAACVNTLAELGRQADQLHMDLMDLAARFSAPLRSKPELGVCFQQLQQAQ